MKKSIVLSMVFVSVASVLHAQTSFGFTAGTIFSNLKAKSGTLSISSKANPGITAGVFVNIPAGKSWSLQPALNYLQKRSTIELEGGNQSSDNKTVIHALEIPVNVVYHAGHFFAGGGPAISMALSGTSTYTVGSEKTKEDINFGDGDNDDMHSFDYGLNAMAGYSFNGRLQVSGHYYAGLSNLAPGDGSDGKLKSNYFGIKLGLLLNHRN